MYPDFQECGASHPLESHNYHREQHWILENYLAANRTFPCNTSVTYTTHGDYTFLDNLEPLTSRWQGPVSMAVYAPGKDFEVTLEAILHLRQCGTEDIKELVSFHIIFPVTHFPSKIPSQTSTVGTISLIDYNFPLLLIPSQEELLERAVDCKERLSKWIQEPTHRLQEGLPYPINLARNIARLAARTYFVLASDVELYPSINFIPEFLKMLQKPDASSASNSRVYVLPVFEVKAQKAPPKTKTELTSMYRAKDAITFHQYVCRGCHTVPRSSAWIRAPIKPGLSVFHIGKRQGSYRKWEPIYVGTNLEPLYDEKLSWEGESDKMTQMYVLCVKDYEFHILDNAFLVHKPGIKKRKKKDPARNAAIKKQHAVIAKDIVPLYKKVFGKRTKCVV